MRRRCRAAPARTSCDTRPGGRARGLPLPELGSAHRGAQTVGGTSRERWLGAPGTGRWGRPAACTWSMCSQESRPRATPTSAGRRPSSTRTISPVRGALSEPIAGSKGVFCAVARGSRHRSAEGMFCSPTVRLATACTAVGRSYPPSRDGTSVRRSRRAWTAAIGQLSTGTRCQRRGSHPHPPRQTLCALGRQVSADARYAHPMDPSFA